jgi:hypothetical protein
MEESGTQKEIIAVKLTPKQKIWSVLQPEGEFFEAKKNLACPICFHNFTPQKLYQIWCSDACEQHANKKMFEIRENKLNAICSSCGLTFRRVNERKMQVVCDTCKRQKQIILRKKDKPIEWKEKNKGVPVSYEELNRRAEYKRVFDESGWTHYCKGRKWDRI